MMHNADRMTVLARRTAPRKVAEAFMPAEIATEEAVVAAASCVCVMMAQRKAAKLEPHVGVDALVLVTEGLADAAKAYRSFALAHSAMIKIPEQNDMPSTYGPTCGPNVAGLTEATNLDRDAA